MQARGIEICWRPKSGVCKTEADYARERSGTARRLSKFPRAFGIALHFLDCKGERRAQRSHRGKSACCIFLQCLAKHTLDGGTRGPPQFCEAPDILRYDLL